MIISDNELNELFSGKLWNIIEKGGFQRRGAAKH